MPTNADELMDELEGLQIMLPCADGWFDEMVWEDNPLLYQLVFLGSLFDLLSLPLFAWRYKRRQRKLRAAAARKAEIDGLGTPHSLKKFTQPSPPPSPPTSSPSPIGPPAASRLPQPTSEAAQVAQDDAAVMAAIEARAAAGVAQDTLERTSRLGKMGESFKLAQQSSWVQMASALAWGSYGPPGFLWAQGAYTHHPGAQFRGEYP